jgi:Zn-finger nucleic acid-binding protein
MAVVDGAHEAFGCTKCGGLWVRPTALLTLPATLPDAPKADARAPSDVRTGPCPEGHGILVRARVGDVGKGFYLERCGTCHGVWFDTGEWERIASTELRAHLDDLWDPQARRAALILRNEARLDTDLRARLGEGLHNELVAVVEALEKHPDRAMALAFIDAHLR